MKTLIASNASCCCDSHAYTVSFLHNLCRGSAIYTRLAENLFKYFTSPRKLCRSFMFVGASIESIGSTFFGSIFSPLGVRL